MHSETAEIILVLALGLGGEKISPPQDLFFFRNFWLVYSIFVKRDLAMPQKVSYDFLLFSK